MCTLPNKQIYRQVYVLRTQLEIRNEQVQREGSHTHMAKILITKTLRMVVDWMGGIKYADSLLLLYHRGEVTIYAFVNYVYIHFTAKRNPQKTLNDWASIRQIRCSNICMPISWLSFYMYLCLCARLFIYILWQVYFAQRL